MLQGLILFDALPSAFWKKKLKRRNSQRAFFPGQTHSIDYATLGFSWLLGAI
jgi:hypothetical protein